MIDKKEGWTWIIGSTKWHYFREGRSICRKWFLLANPSEGYELGNEDSKDNCVGCARKLKAEKENENTPA